MDIYYVYSDKEKVNISSALLSEFKAKGKAEAKRLYIQKELRTTDSVLCDYENNIIYS